MSFDTAWTETERPTLETERLVLRPFAISDAKDVQRMAGHPLVAATTASIPHPYPDGAAEDWIGRQAEWFEQKQAVHFAITLKSTRELIGCISLFAYSATHSKAELGYWIGVDHWNKGLCTEAARPVIEYGFARMHLNKVVARHVDSNPSSGRVMTKVGLKQEGVLRQDFFKHGTFHDSVVYGVTKSDRACAK